MTRMIMAFVGSRRPAAQALHTAFVSRYGQASPDQADVIVAVGGDGTALSALHATILRGGKPVYLVRAEGSVGFLGQNVAVEELPERIRAACAVTLHPLRADVLRQRTAVGTVFGINDIVLARDRLQSVKLILTVHGQRGRMNFTGDGLVVATPLGSTAYTYSLGGPCLPLDCGMLALTAIAPRRGSAWSSLVVPDHAAIEVEVVEAEHRPARLETASDTVSNVERVWIACDRSITLNLLVDNHEHRLIFP